MYMMNFLNIHWWYFVPLNHWIKSQSQQRQIIRCLLDSTSAVHHFLSKTALCYRCLVVNSTKTTALWLKVGTEIEWALCIMSVLLQNGQKSMDSEGSVVHNLNFQVNERHISGIVFAIINSAHYKTVPTMSREAAENKSWSQNTTLDKRRVDEWEVAGIT